MATTEEVVAASFEDKVKKLEASLKKLKDLIPENGSENRGEQLHGFGPHNLYLEQETINDMVVNMQKQYQKFTAMTNTTTITKLTNEKLFLSNLKNPLKATLEAAMSKIREVAMDTTLKTTILKLEAISLEEGLGFDCEQMNSNCFISSDMFYIEVILDNTGQPNDVKLHGHTGEPKSCKDLIHILRNKDYKEFRSHLQGLKNRYLFLKGHITYQSKILSALEALEEDIMKIMKSDITCNMVSDCIRSGPVGYVIPGDGGKNLQMTYLADPLILLDLVNQGVIKVFSLEEPLSRSIGYSAVLSMRQAPSTFLPISSLAVLDNNKVHYTKQDISNSEELPAVFVLNLSKPLPASIHTVRAINQHLSKSDKFTHSSSANLDDLILTQESNMSRKQWGNREFRIELTEQTHLFTFVPSEDKANIGLLLSSIPFTHPLQLPILIKILRAQAIYNLLFCSCANVCENKAESEDKPQLLFDVTASSWNTLTVTFLHPIDQSIASVDFSVSSECYVESSLNIAPGSPVISSNSFMNKIVNRTLSLPITMRSVFKKAESYKPETDKSSIQKTREKRAVRPIKLQMPTLAQIQSEMPLMSPHILSSPSTFLNFSPGAPLFMSDPVQKGTISKKRTPANLTPLGTPNSDGSRTPNKQKLPKITLKRKRNEDTEIYEIDQTKSDFEMDTNTPIEKPNDSFAFSYSQNESDSKKSQPLFTDNFANVTMEENDLDGLLGIPNEPFSQGSSAMSSNLPPSANVPAFDLDAITSGRDVLLMDTIPASIIDPSALVKTPNSFDMESIDIDSLMNP